MTQAFDVTSAGPMVVEVWAPTCSACRAMQPDVDDVVAEYGDRVGFRAVNAAVEPDLVRSLGVKATPTLIGFRDGVEVFRVAGRRSLGELRGLFDAAAGTADPGNVGRTDTALRVGAGGVLATAGLLAGPAWPLVVIGGAVVAAGLIPWMRRMA